jgi:hypothetical protein
MNWDWNLDEPDSGEESEAACNHEEPCSCDEPRPVRAQLVPPCAACGASMDGDHRPDCPTLLDDVGF